MGNHVLMRLLDSQSGLMLIDECSHYSIFEAARCQRGADILVCRRDLLPLRPQRPSCQAEAARRTFAIAVVLSDGVFAATGRIAPVREYYDSCAAIRARYYVSTTPTRWPCLEKTAGEPSNTLAFGRESPLAPVGEGPGVRAAEHGPYPRPPAGEGPGVRAAGKSPNNLSQLAPNSAPPALPCSFPAP